MKIEQIELYNFGSYEGVNLFEFMCDDASKRIVIVGGKNGAGKTTLFTAMQICLYGHASFGFRNSGKRYLKEIFDLINNHARLDESQSAHVKIHFSEERINMDHYEVIRAWTWNDNTIDETFTVRQNGVELGEEATLDFQNYLLHLIPPELHKLYFFDGEKIADYFLDEQHNNIKDALLVLSGNDTYEILYNNVRRLLNGVESDSESVAQNYADQKDALARYKKKEETLLSEQQDILSTIDRLEAKLQSENDEYTSSGGVTLEEWKDLQRLLKDEEDQRERLNLELKEIAANVLPFLIVKDLLPNIRAQISIENELQAYKAFQGALLALPFRKWLSAALKKTSSQNNTSDSKILMNAIQEFFEKQDLKTKEPILKLSEDESSSIISKVSSIEAFETSTISKIHRKIKESRQHSTELRERLQKSSIENFESHIEHVTQIATQLATAKVQQERNASELLTVQDQIVELKKVLGVSRKALEGELKKQSVSRLSDRVLLLVEELQDQQYKKLIASVERDLNQKFRELIRKDNFVDYIYLDHDFSLHLVRNQTVEVSALKLAVKKHGTASLKGHLKDTGYYSLIEQLNTTENSLKFALAEYSANTITLPIELDHNHFSNGEKQVLVMSLYWAIMNQSHNELPFIIDTPFARIDTEHRANITERFFKELHGQLFVLSTNEELRHEHIVALTQQIANVYMLDYGKDKRTRISAGSYFEVK